MKILAIPFAGGNKYSYEMFQKILPTSVEWITLELSGRGGRASEPLMTTVQDVVKDLYQQVTAILEKGEEQYLIYGHSLGALLGYELTLQIEQSSLPKPKHVFLSGRSAPMIAPRTDWTNLPSEEFWRKVDGDGGLPEGFLESQELKDYYYPILVSDFKLISHYTHPVNHAKIQTPVTVWVGSQEINDTEDGFKVEEVEAWQEVCEQTVEMETYEGNHFFIFNHAPALIKVMRASCH